MVDFPPTVKDSGLSHVYIPAHGSSTDEIHVFQYTIRITTWYVFPVRILICVLILNKVMRHISVEGLCSFILYLDLMNPIYGICVKDQKN